MQCWSAHVSNAALGFNHKQALGGQVYIRDSSLLREEDLSSWPGHKIAIDHTTCISISALFGGHSSFVQRTLLYLYSSVQVMI